MGLIMRKGIPYGENGAAIVPIASKEVLGGVKIGDSLTITGDGVLDASSTLPEAEKKGQVLTSDEDGEVIWTEKYPASAIEGQLLASDGNGGAKWITVENAEGVGF